MAPKKKRGKRSSEKGTYGEGSEYRERGKLVASYRINGKSIRFYAADRRPESEIACTTWRQTLKALEDEGYDLTVVPHDVLMAFYDPQAVAAWKETVSLFARHSTPIANAEELMNSFVEKWIRDDLGHRRGRTGEGLSPGTWRQYYKVLRLYILPQFGTFPMRDMIDPHRIEVWRNDLATDCSPQVAAEAWGILHDMLRAAVRWKVIPYHPMRESDPPYVPPHEAHPLSIEELRRVFTLIQGHRFEPIYHVAVFLGLRISECVGLQWRNINWEKGTLTVDGQLQLEDGVKKRRPYTKGGKPRTIPIPPRLLEMLRRHYDAQRKLAAVTENWQEYGYVFPTPIGTPLSQRTVFDHFKGQAETKWQKRRLGVVHHVGLNEETVFHDLRHTCGGLLVSVGSPEAVIAAILGHSSKSIPEMTRLNKITALYSHAFTETVRQSLAEIEMLIWPASLPHQQVT